MKNNKIKKRISQIKLNSSFELINSPKILSDLNGGDCSCDTVGSVCNGPKPPKPKPNN